MAAQAPLDADAAAASAIRPESTPGPQPPQPGIGAPHIGGQHIGGQAGGWHWLHPPLPQQ